MGGGGSKTTSYARKNPVEKKSVMMAGSGGIIFDCDDLEEIGTLLNQNIAVINALSPGDVLKVQLDASDVVIAVDNKGNVCGNVSIASLSKLIECLKAGHKFKANLLSLKPTVSIEVQPT